MTHSIKLDFMPPRKKAAPAAKGNGPSPQAQLNGFLDRYLPEIAAEARVA